MQEKKCADPDCGKCKFNHKCCSEFRVLLNKKEVSKFKYKTLTNVKENGKVIGMAWRLTWDEEGVCNYFNKITNLCKIQDEKPMVCKKWKECLEWP